MERHTQIKEAEILTDLLKIHSPTEVADGLCVHNVHVYRFKGDGYISPTLKDALVENGFIPEPPTRVRSCLDWGYGDDAMRARDIFNKCGVSMKSVALSWLNDNSWLIKKINNADDAAFLIEFMLDWYSEE